MVAGAGVEAWVLLAVVGGVPACSWHDTAETRGCLHVMVAGIARNAAAADAAAAAVAARMHACMHWTLG